MKTIRLFFLLITVMAGQAVAAQGCSDAGFCTIGNLAAHHADTAILRRNKLTFLTAAGVGDESVFVLTPAFEYTRMFSPQWSVAGKLTANYATGNLGSTAGLGDVFLSGTYTFNPAATWKVSATGGAKLPLNNSNLKAGGKPLPMQYQSSLGSVDVITGLAITKEHWQVAAGWQQPLTGANQNGFLPVYWSKPSASNYPPSNAFRRRGDVLLRSGYTFGNGHSKWSLTGGLLSIYHLGEDVYKDVSGKAIAIEGSQGLTLNLTAAGNYRFSSRCSIGFTGGVPLLVRQVRPDGLTRSFVFSPQLTYAF